MEEGKRFAKIAHPGKRAFLEAFALTGIPKSGVHAADISRSTLTNWLRDDADFAECYREAREEAGDRFEEEAIRRAVDGVEKATTVAGERELVRVYSDELLKTVLSATKPEKYRTLIENRHTGAGGGPIQIDLRGIGRLIMSDPAMLEMAIALADRVQAAAFPQAPDVDELPEAPAIDPHMNGHANGTINGTSNGEAHG